mmetsp:Transcript_27371/g.38428  ORF Transcript_27371/g.38428 Transcript_27371/m.38428 type:complete len:227 (-) Transcript_27371:603-1283(-)
MFVPSSLQMPIVVNCQQLCTELSHLLGCLSIGWFMLPQDFQSLKNLAVQHVWGFQQVQLFCDIHLQKHSSDLGCMVRMGFLDSLEQLFSKGVPLLVGVHVGQGSSSQRFLTRWAWLHSHLVWGSLGRRLSISVADIPLEGKRLSTWLWCTTTASSNSTSGASSTTKLLWSSSCGTSLWGWTHSTRWESTSSSTSRWHSWSTLTTPLGWHHSTSWLTHRVTRVAGLR